MTWQEFDIICSVILWISNLALRRAHGQLDRCSRLLRSLAGLANVENLSDAVFVGRASGRGSWRAEFPQRDADTWLGRSLALPKGDLPPRNSAKHGELGPAQSPKSQGKVQGGHELGARGPLEYPENVAPWPPCDFPRLFDGCHPITADRPSVIESNTQQFFAREIAVADFGRFW